MQLNYAIGDFITYRVFSDMLRTVRVTRRYRNVKNNRPGFEGIGIVDGKETGADCWGYDSQIEKVVSRLGASPRPEHRGTVLP